MWEYRIVYVTPVSNSYFNALGQAGWELVAVCQARDEGKPTAYFKRPINQQSEE